MGKDWLRRGVRAVLPPAIRWRLRSPQHAAELQRYLAQLRQDVEPETALLQSLRRAWGNSNYSADCEYIRAVVRAGRGARGPVLECGSGLTTLLLAFYAGARGVPVYSLEHELRWRALVRRHLARAGLQATVLHAPLVSRGAFDWYQLPADLPSGFDLVVCDGPPATVRGGRSGMMPVCGSRLAPGCTILLDDADRADLYPGAGARFRGCAVPLEGADRPGGQGAIAGWTQEFGLSCTLHHSSEGDFAELTVPADTRRAAHAEEQV